LALMSGVELPLFALRSQLASAVDIIVQTARLRDGRRMVTHITEVTGADPQRGYAIRDIFVSMPAVKQPDGSVYCELLPTGVLPNCLPLLHAQGLDLPKGVLENARAARGGRA
jgi:pilus assembly protein CpaF